MRRMAERDIDVVVFGATSVTGRRVSAYLAKRAPALGLSWAAGARDLAKLDTILAEDGVAGATTIAADVTDPGALAAMASRSRVVLNLVGPYTSYGRPVIDACVAGGASYVDLSGEMPFVSRTTREVHGAATAAGVKVVQVCGFEALPPDLAVALAAETALERWQEDLAEVELAVRTLELPPGLPRPSDVLSGGTMQSLAQAVGDEDAADLLDPACLVPDAARAAEVRTTSPISVRPRRAHDGATIAPMAPAAFINPAVIQRTAALCRPARPVFRYREGFAFDGGAASLPARYAVAGVLAGLQVGAGRVASASPSVRGRASNALSRVLPSSGFGPRADRLEAWRWSMDVSAQTTGGHEVVVEIEGSGHPGYLATARMLGEAGLLLAEPGATPDGSGCLTPALALGTAEVQRFDAAGVTFRVV